MNNEIAAVINEMQDVVMNVTPRRFAAMKGRIDKALAALQSAEPESPIDLHPDRTYRRDDKVRYAPPDYNWDAQAYATMRDEIQYWKSRAVESDAALYRLQEELSPTHMGEPVLHDQVKAMVDRFLSWRLPKEFHPDCGIDFTAPSPEHTAWWPTGTNLFDAEQATEMVRHMLGFAALQAEPVFYARGDLQDALRADLKEGVDNTYTREFVVPLYTAPQPAKVPEAARLSVIEYLKDEINEGAAYDEIVMDEHFIEGAEAVIAMLEAMGTTAPAAELTGYYVRFREDEGSEMRTVMVAAENSNHVPAAFVETFKGLYRPLSECFDYCAWPIAPAAGEGEKVRYLVERKKGGLPEWEVEAHPTAENANECFEHCINVEQRQKYQGSLRLVRESRRIERTWAPTPPAED